MNGASKILTVSYGTFSCTLEGFDDPFNTMKAIAEYFRDLAAEDRYFGAEPPTPDAAMLHRIAEREIQRRVEAKIQENGVVLRASEPAEPSLPAVAPVAAAPAARVTEAAPAVAAPAVMPSVAPAAVMGAVAPGGESAPESAVERLMRLRSDVAAQPVAESPVATSPVVSFALPEYVEDLVEAAVEAEMPQDAEMLADLLPEDAPDVGAEDPVAAVEVVAEPEAEAEEIAAVLASVVAEAAPMDGAVAEAVAEVAAVDEAVAEAVAEVAALGEMEPQSDAEPVIDALLQADSADAVVEDEAAFDVFAEDEVAAVDLPEGLARALAASHAAEAAPEEAADAAVDTTAEAAVDLTAAAQDETDEAMLSALSETLAETLAGGLADTQPDLTDGAEAAIVADDVETVAEAASDMAQEAVEAPAASEATDASVAAFLSEAEPAAGTASAPGAMELRPGAQEKLLRARARVIRIRKAEDDEGQAVAASETVAEAMPAEESAISDYVSALAEEPEDAPAKAEAPVAAAAAAAAAKPSDVPDLETMGEVEMILSPEDEAALQRELAALSGTNEDEDARRDADVVADLSVPQDGRRGFEGPSADEAVSRLMQQTDTEMEGSEAKRRLSAIQHLRAAVAATVAERKVTGEAPQDTEKVSRLARYRSDLAMAVKNVLPGRGGDAQAERPAPLVLVSEQRIDRPRPAAPAAPQAPAGPIAPVRPRRVSSSLAMQAAEAFDEDGDEDEIENIAGDSRGFAEFVEKVGAESLEQILEAAAAYLSGVEGRDHFSRPALMQNLAAVVPEGSFQREDGLRSFGALLRKGRIAKIRRGRFTLTEDSVYLAEARKITG